MSVSQSALDSGFKNNNIIKAEAIANCDNTEKWAGFLCLLGLSSVLSCNIVSCYPDFGVENISQPINVIIDTNVKEKRIKNRQILRSIVDAIIFCSQTNTPLRGHRDDSQYLLEAREYSKCGTGCFNKLLNFAVRNGNGVLGSHLNNCSKNASYILQTSQNEIIKCCGEEISESILSEVRKNVFFSIIADEACDSSTKEQMSLVLRFVDSDFNIREDFIQFIHCSEGVKGKDLFNVLLN
nr:unnamed protein product [Hydra vulgaris]